MPTSQRRKLEYAKTALFIHVRRHVETEPDSIFFLERVAARTSGWQFELLQSTDDPQAGQRHATDQVGRHQHVAVHLANVLEERKVVLGPGRRVEMHDLQICQHGRAVFVHGSVEWKSFVPLARKLIVQTIFRPLTFYRQITPIAINQNCWSLQYSVYMVA